MTKDEIERIKREVALVPLVQERGIVLKKHGADYKGLCPFHNDRKTPNLVVTPSKNLWHCFVCNVGGSNLDFVMKYDKVSFRHAFAKLDGKESLVEFTPPTNADITNGIVKQKLLNRVVEFYHQTFLKEQRGQEYLLKRGIYSVEAIKRFKIGYANRTLGYAVPWDSKLREPLREVGIFNHKNGLELFNGCVVFPVMDVNGNVTEIYGRKVSDNQRKGSVLHLYLPGPHRGIWNAAAFTTSTEIILCESAIDAMTFFVFGFTNVTFSYGVAGFTDEHLQMLNEKEITTVFIAYDNDKAGNKAALKVAEKLGREGITSYRLRFPANMDANLYARKVTPGDQSLGVLFQEPELVPGKPSSLVVPVSVQSTAKHGKEARVDDCSVSTDHGSTEDVELSAAKGEVDITLDDSSAGSNGDPATSDGQAAAKEINGGKSSGDVDSVMSAAPALDEKPKKLDVKKRRNGIYLSIKDREYRIQGLEKNKSYGVMKVAVRVSRNGCYYLDTLDLVQKVKREMYIKNAAEELELNRDIIKRDLGRILLSLEKVQEELLEADIPVEDDVYQMTEHERKAALAALRSPDLVQRILSDLHTCGIVNEDTILLVSYLATISRLFDDPLAIMFQASPGSGKSTVMDAILDFVPDEDKRVFTYMTGQSLFYSGENDLAHKVLGIEEDEGAEKASYSLKIMQSARRISIQSTGTDPQTGRHKSFTTNVNGPVAIFSSTTKPFIEEELMMRFLGLGADESRNQTMAVLKKQRENEMLDGLFRSEQAKKLIQLHQNMQRLLHPIRVINPFADQLTFPSSNLRTRRDQKKYLIMIRATAFLFQYQRKRKTMILDGSPIEYIEVIPSDINLAYKLACEVMGRTLDELAPQTKSFLDMQVTMVREVCDRLDIEKSDLRYSQKELREYTGWSAYQVKEHQKRLVELEYVYLHKGRNGRQYEYELVYDGEGERGQKFVLGIANVEKVADPQSQVNPK